jgi:hypothetical protein
VFYILVGSNGFYFIILFYFGENFAKIVGVLIPKKVFWGKILINFQENRVLDWVCQI